MLKATNSSASGITTYAGLYPNKLTISGYCTGGGFIIIKSSRTAREKLWSRSARVNIINPNVKLDLIFLYIPIYDTKSTSSRTMFPAVI